MYISHDRRLERFKDRPQKPGDQTIAEWVADVRRQMASRGMTMGEQPAYILDHLAGKARKEIVGRGDAITKDAEKIFQVLLKVFGDGESLALLQQQFFSYRQREEEDLVTCSLELVDLYDRIVALDSSFSTCKESNLKGRLAESVRDEGLRRELRRINLENSKLSFFDARDQALVWYGRSTKTHPKPRNVATEELTADETSVENIVRVQSRQIKAQQEQINQLLEFVTRGRQQHPPDRGLCFKCNSPDHIKRNCPEMEKKAASPASTQPPANLN
ncbi:uncharacterized protein [Apostichopus japonicus]|uniref:uncharacterized protein n=1 Tax=Stichopus japonicus TaxID=307972 RepID=UPI003AB74ECD